MIVKVQMFGAFRVLGDQIEVKVREGGSVSDLRDSMLQYAQNADLSDLLAVSKFASQSSVLGEDAICSSGEVLAILPPVSGG